MAKKSSDQLCTGGRGNTAVGNLGDLDDLPNGERHDPNMIRHPENRRARILGVKITLGQKAKDEDIDMFH